MSNQRNSFEDGAPVDEIYGCPIFKCIAQDYMAGEYKDNSPQMAASRWTLY